MTPDLSDPHRPLHELQRRLELELEVDTLGRAKGSVDEGQPSELLDDELGMGESDGGGSSMDIEGGSYTKDVRPFTRLRRHWRP